MLVAGTVAPDVLALTALIADITAHVIAAIVADVIAANAVIGDARADDTGAGHAGTRHARAGLAHVAVLAAVFHAALRVELVAGPVIPDAVIPDAIITDPVIGDAVVAAPIVTDAVVVTAVVGAASVVAAVALDVLRPGHPVVVVDVALVIGGEVVVGVELGGVLDAVLVERELKIVAGEAMAAHGHERRAHAEQSVAHLDERGLARVVVDEDLLDAAQLVAVLVERGGVEQVLDFPLGGHVVNPFVPDSAYRPDRRPGPRRRSARIATSRRLIGCAVESGSWALFRAVSLIGWRYGPR